MRNLNMAAVAASLAACGAGERAGLPEAIVRDSAGIRIVENHEPRWRAGEGWRVPVEPRTRIGVVDGEAEHVCPLLKSTRDRQQGAESE